MTIRVRGRVQAGKLELDEPIELPDGEPVDVVVQSADAAEAQSWCELGIARLEEEWDNPDDAVYNDWRTLYGV